MGLGANRKDSTERHGGVQKARFGNIYSDTCSVNLKDSVGKIRLVTDSELYTLTRNSRRPVSTEREKKARGLVSQFHPSKSRREEERRDRKATKEKQPSGWGKSSARTAETKVRCEKLVFSSGRPNFFES